MLAISDKVHFKCEFVSDKYIKIWQLLQYAEAMSSIGLVLKYNMVLKGILNDDLYLNCPTSNLNRTHWVYIDRPFST